MAEVVVHLDLGLAGEIHRQPHSQPLHLHHLLVAFALRVAQTAFAAALPRSVH